MDARCPTTVLDPPAQRSDAGLHSRYAPLCHTVARWPNRLIVDCFNNQENAITFLTIDHR